MCRVNIYVNLKNFEKKLQNKGIFVHFGTIFAERLIYFLDGEQPVPTCVYLIIIVQKSENKFSIKI
jgi:hypothetical protein